MVFTELYTIYSMGWVKGWKKNPGEVVGVSIIGEKLKMNNFK